MATITSAASGNFSAGATWVGGVVPGAGDDAVAATGHVVTIDVDTTVLSVSQAGTGRFVLPGGITLTGNVTINAGTFATFGTVEATAGVGTTSTINGNVSGASSTLVNQAGVVMTGLGSLVINGSVTGTPGNVADNTASECAAVYTNVASAVTVNGAVTGGGTRKYGVYAGSSSTSASLTVVTVGNISGGSGSSAHGIYHTGSSGTVNATATTVQGSGGNAFGIYHTGTSGVVTATATTIQGGGGSSAIGVFHQGTSGTVTATATTIQGGGGGGGIGILHQGTSGTVTATATTVQGGGGGSAHGINHTGNSGTITATGIVQGGGGATAHGISHGGTSGTVTAIGEAKGGISLQHGILSSATTNGVVFTGDITDHPSGTVAVSTRLFRISDTSPSGVTTYANTAGFPNGTPVSRVSPDNVTGMAQEADVRLSTVYGYNGELTGQLAVPPPQSVAAGVPTDNTVGSAALDLGDVAAVVGQQIAAAVTPP